MQLLVIIISQVIILYQTGYKYSSNFSFLIPCSRRGICRAGLIMEAAMHCFPKFTLCMGHFFFGTELTHTTAAKNKYQIVRIVMCSR